MAETINAGHAKHRALVAFPGVTPGSTMTGRLLAVGGRNRLAVQASRKLRGHSHGVESWNDVTEAEARAIEDALELLKAGDAVMTLDDDGVWGCERMVAAGEAPRGEPDGGSPPTAAVPPPPEDAGGGTGGATGSPEKAPARGRGFDSPVPRQHDTDDDVVDAEIIDALIAEVRRLRSLLARCVDHIDPNDSDDAFRLLVECEEASRG